MSGRCGAAVGRCELLRHAAFAVGRKVLGVQRFAGKKGSHCCVVSGNARKAASSVVGGVGGFELAEVWCEQLGHWAAQGANQGEGGGRGGRWCRAAFGKDWAAAGVLELERGAGLRWRKCAKGVAMLQRGLQALKRRCPPRQQPSELSLASLLWLRQRAFDHKTLDVVRALCLLPLNAATPRGFKPLWAEPSGFRVHLLSRSDTVSCFMVQDRPLQHMEMKGESEGERERERETRTLAQPPRRPPPAAATSTHTTHHHPPPPTTHPPLAVAHVDSFFILIA